MDRRNALRMMGTLVVCMAGVPTVEAVTNDDSGVADMDWWKAPIGPTSYTFTAEGIKDIIIEKRDGGKIVIPFDDIVEALEAK